MTPATDTSCAILEDSDYNLGANVNNGMSDQDILYLGSCQSFCRSKYPASTHFSFVTANVSSANERNACWCKSSGGTASTKAGVISGVVPCAGIGKEMDKAVIKTWKKTFNLGT